MPTTEQILESLNSEALSGRLAKASMAELEQYAAALCHSLAYTVFAGTGQFPQICETVRLHLLRAHITDLNKKNALTQRLVIALTVMSLITSVVQIFSPVLFREQFAASAPQKQETQLSAPAPTVPPLPHPAKTQKP